MLNSRIFSFFSLFIYIPLALYTHRPSLQSAGIYQAREERREEETKNNICECDEKWKRGENVMETIGLGRRWRHYRFKKILLYYYYYYLPCLRRDDRRRLVSSVLERDRYRNRATSAAASTMEKRKSRRGSSRVFSFFFSLPRPCNQLPLALLLLSGTPPSSLVLLY